MKFNELLNDYISRLGCTAKELSIKSGLSASVISRYRAGERVPFTGSEQLMRLSSGLALLAKEKINKTMLNEDIYSSLLSALSGYRIDYDMFIDKLNRLINTLEINLTELAKSMNFDVSFLSKIRSGQRKPANVEKFLDNICSYITEHFSSEKDKIIVSETISCRLDALKADKYFLTLKLWLSTKQEPSNISFCEMLGKFDDFDVDEYIRGYEFKDFGISSFSDSEAISKNYYGKQNMWRAFEEFFYLTLSSDSKEPIFIAADFPFNVIADETLGEGTFISLLFTCISKGIKINILHDLNKPNRVTLSNLKVWIPLYMTGMIHPYYLKNETSEIYKNVTCVSGVAALHGECIGDEIDEGKIYLTNSPEELNYYRRKAYAIIRKAYPFMEVYTEKQKNLFLAMLESDSMTQGKRHNILPSLPIYTIPEKLLKKILNRHNISEQDQDYLLLYARKHRSIADRIVQKSVLIDEIVVPPKEQFENGSVAVSLLEAFYGKQVYYTFDEFIEHLNATKEYEGQNKNYKIKYKNKKLFKNLRFSLHDDKWVIVSKNNTPIVHFIIRHPGFRKIIDIYSPEETEK